MKKTLIILILVLAYQFTNAQVKVLGRIEPNGATDKYPTHVDSLGRGGLMAAASWQERNAIPTARRKAGMLVRVKSASVDSTYTLGVGLANADWAPYAPTANITNINQIPARSYNDLQDKPIIPDDAKLLHSTGSEVKNGDLTLDGMLVLRNNNQVSLSSVNNSYNGSLRGDGVQFSNLSGNIKTNFSNDGIWFKYNGNGQTVLRGQPVSSGFNTVELPITSGVLALTSDLPNVSGKANLTGGNSFAGNQTVNGNIGIAINNAYLIDGSTALEASGGYLRLNQGSAFSNGVYTPSAFRVDGGFTSLGTGYFGGNVGIGTSTPTEKLDVNGGRIKVTSDEGVATIKGGEIVLGNLEGNSSQIKMDNTTIVASSAFPIEVGLPSYSGVLALTSQLDGKANLSGGNTFTGANTVLPASNAYGVTVDARNIYDGGGFRYFAGDDADLSNAIEAWGVDYPAPAFEVNRSGAVKLRNYDESKYASLTTDRIIFRDENSGFTGAIGTSAMWLSSEADVTYQVNIDQPVPHVLLQGSGTDDRAKLEMGKLELTKDVDRNVILDAKSTTPNILVNSEYVGSAVLATNSLTFNRYSNESVSLRQAQTTGGTGSYNIIVPNTNGLMQVANVKEVTSSYFVQNTDYTIVANNNISVTLPDPAYETLGRVVVISVMSDEPVNIGCSASNKIFNRTIPVNSITTGYEQFPTYTFQLVQKSGVKYWRVLSVY